MEYIAKAFVIVSDTKLQKELTDKLDKMFPNDEGNHLEDASCFVADEGCIYKSYFCPVIDFIECNDYTNGDEDLAVKLFLALAEMRDGDNRFRYADLPYFENGIGRTIERGEIIDTKQEKWNDFKCKELYTELTPKQLAEAVRDGKITKEQLINK